MVCSVITTPDNYLHECVLITKHLCTYFKSNLIAVDLSLKPG